MSEPNPAANRSILLVADDPPTRAGLMTCLQHAGYNVTSAWIKAEVLALVRCHPFDLVLTDVIMPQIDGTEVISAVARYRPSTPVVAMSDGGFYPSSELSLKIAKSTGTVVMLVKPFRFEELLKAVEGALLGKSSNSETVSPG